MWGTIFLTISQNRRISLCYGEVGGFFLILLQPFHFFVWQIAISIDCLFWALRNARRTVYALIGIYHQIFFGFPKGFYWADMYAILVFAPYTSTGNYVGHNESTVQVISI